MKPQSYKTWWLVKGKITSRFGSVTACANRFHCSPSALRKATQGLCPLIAERLKRELEFDWETNQPEEAVA